MVKLSDAGGIFLVILYERKRKEQGMEDRHIVELYLQRNERAIAETHAKYGRYCHYIAYNILSSNEDAEEIVNDTYLKVWNRIPPDRPDPLKPYVGMISRQLALNAYNANLAQKRGGGVSLAMIELEECIPDTARDLADSAALTNALNSFLAQLPSKTRKVFLCRYWYGDPIAVIAKDLSMKESAVAMLLLRTRQKLKEHLEKEGLSI